jgi:hypothetical protein
LIAKYILLFRRISISQITGDQNPSLLVDNGLVGYSNKYSLISKKVINYDNPSLDWSPRICGNKFIAPGPFQDFINGAKMALN